MSNPSQTSRQLLEIAMKTYRSEILDGLEGSNRYVGAMIANAIDIAARGLAADDPDQHLSDLQQGDFDADALAKALRSGEVSEQSHAGLRDTLVANVRARLAINNPRFLKSREG